MAAVLAQYGAQGGQLFGGVRVFADEEKLGSTQAILQGYN